MSKPGILVFPFVVAFAPHTIPLSCFSLAPYLLPHPTIRVCPCGIVYVSILRRMCLLYIHRADTSVYIYTYACCTRVYYTYACWLIHACICSCVFILCFSSSALIYELNLLVCLLGRLLVCFYAPPPLRVSKNPFEPRGLRGRRGLFEREWLCSAPLHLAAAGDADGGFGEFGCGSQLTSQGYAGFCLWFHFNQCVSVWHMFLSHSHFSPLT